MGLDKKDAYVRDLSPYKEEMTKRALLALRDDIGEGDITTLAIFSESSRVEEAVIIAKSDGVLSGVFEAKEVLAAGGLKVEFTKEEGEFIEKGSVVARIVGDVREILARERTALNYLQVLSGIATVCHKLNSRFPGKVASLRKTHPGLSFSEKRSVLVGGALTHRLGLFDGFLIKDNHLAAVARELFGSTQISEEQKIKAIEESLRRAKAYRDRCRLFKCFIEVEVESLAQAKAAAVFHMADGVPDIILLDNMSPTDVSICVKAIREIAGFSILIEASGGITPNNLEQYIKAGVDVASMSFLTFNAPPLDFSLKIVGYK
jgi:nicotinate-nucleotide pyrophosphorylase (carboxylating)